MNNYKKNIGGSMKNLKLMALLLAAGMIIGIGSQANAEVGYIDYQRVLEN